MTKRFDLATLCSALDRLGIDVAFSGEASERAYRFCSLDSPDEDGLYFFEGPPSALPQLPASPLVLAAEPVPGISTLVVPHPQLTFYRLMEWAFPAAAPEAGIHPTAIVDEAASIDASAHVRPYCIVGAAEIGPGVVLESHVVVHEGSVIGRDVRVQAHSVIGATGVAWSWDPDADRRVMQPQIGATRIGAGCFLGTDVTVVRGSVSDVTELGENCVIAHGSKIGHGSLIGAEVHFANNVSIGGSARIGNRAFLGSGCVMRPRARIADGTIVGAGAVVVRDIEQPDQVVSGTPARPMPVKDRHRGVPRRPT